MAGASFSIQVDGLPDLQRKMNAMSVDLRRRAIRVALRAAAMPVRDEARRLAPVDTGGLRGDVFTRVTVTGTKTEAAIGPGKKHFYGMFTELGTRYQPAQPWLRPALDTQKEIALRRLRDILARAINKYASKAGIA